MAAAKEQRRTPRSRGRDLAGRQAAPEALLEVAEERDARMIVVGSYGEAPLKGAILGSTPNKLLHIADRPVLVVPGRAGRELPKKAAW